MGLSLPPGSPRRHPVLHPAPQGDPNGKGAIGGGCAAGAGAHPPGLFWLAQLLFPKVHGGGAGREDQRGQPRQKPGAKRRRSFHRGQPDQRGQTAEGKRPGGGGLPRGGPPQLGAGHPGPFRESDGGPKRGSWQRTGGCFTPTAGTWCTGGRTAPRRASARPSWPGACAPCKKAARVEVSTRAFAVRAIPRRLGPGPGSGPGGQGKFPPPKEPVPPGAAPLWGRLGRASPQRGCNPPAAPPFGR